MAEEPTPINYDLFHAGLTKQDNPAVFAPRGSQGMGSVIYETKSLSMAKKLADKLNELIKDDKRMPPKP